MVGDKISLVVVLLVVPPALATLRLALGLSAVLALLVVGPAALWLRGPTVGFERRAALLAGVPLLNLYVLVPAVWRAAHLHLQRWQGPLDPRWNDEVWRFVVPLTVVGWLASLAATTAWLVWAVA